MTPRDTVTIPEPEGGESVEDVADRLDIIRARVEAATEGPWRVEGFNPGRDGGEFRVRGVTQRAGYHRDEEKDRVVATAPVVPATHRDQAEANAHLIASARSDVPYLLSLVEDVLEGRDQIHTQVAGVVNAMKATLDEPPETESVSEETVRRWMKHLSVALRDAAQEGGDE